MRRRFFYAALVSFAATCIPAVQLTAQGAPQQGARVDWNARAPWGRQSMGPLDKQAKEPFKIFDNVWFVGLQDMSPYLVTTSAGHVLFDATYDQTADLVLDNIRKAGFNPREIKYLIVTHAHSDHFAGAEKIRQATGARVGMSLEDWKSTEMQQAAPGAQNMGPRLTRDLVIEDGQKITLGDQTFTFYVTPGHTPGATTTAYTAREGNRTYRVLTPGGLGIPAAAEWSQPYLKSMERLKSLGPWDVILTNHPDMMVPKKWPALEQDLKNRRAGDAHPVVAGPAPINAWFDEVIKVVNEKIAAEKGIASAR